MMPQNMDAEIVVNKKSETAMVTADGSKEPIKIAPGEGKIPTNIMREEFMDVKAFPRHHPSGYFGLNHPRKFKLSLSQYYNQRLLNEDERFSRDAFYVFMAASCVERHSLEQNIDISGIKGQQDSYGGGATRINLTDMFDMFKKVKGTPKYWQTAKNELVAKVKQLGPFHIFYTFSCGEMRWSEVFVSLLKRKGFEVEIPDQWDGNDATLLVEGKELWDYVNNDMSDSKHVLFKDYTFLISRLFDARVKSFIKNILLNGQVPISHYSYRVEFQARGLPHIHGVGWIEKKYLLDRGISGDLMDNEIEAVKLADQMISCRLPDPKEPLGEIVSHVQKHKHTKSCLKYSGVCRYGFPQLPSPKTLVAKPIEMIYPDMTEEDKKKLRAKAEEVLGNAKKLLNDPNFNENMKLAEFLEAIDVHEEEYLKYLGISKRGKILILKRECKEAFINNYNPEMLRAWNANMDIQLTVDPYAVISYIASYTYKDETQTTAFLRDTLKATAGKETKERLKALKECYLTHRQVGASEAAYKVNPSLRLKDSNITCVFVMTGFPEKRSHFFKKVSNEDDDDNFPENGDDDSDSDEEFEQQKPPASKRIKIEGRSGMYQQSVTIMDRYTKRPNYLKDMCLSQFAISYVHASTIPKRVDFDEDGCSNEYSEQTIFNSTKYLPRYISLQNNLGKMRLRSFPAVMRIHNSKKKDGHEKNYSELLLYTSWRDEKHFHSKDFEKCIEIYKNKLEEIVRNKDMIYPGEGTIDLLENFDLEANKPEHVYDALDNQRQQEKEDDQVEGAIDDPEYETFAYTGNLVHENEVIYESSKYRKVEIPIDDEVNFLTRRCVSEQLDVLRQVVGYCKDVIRSQKNLTHVVDPLQVIVHGGAGKKLFNKSLKIHYMFIKESSIIFRCWKECCHQGCFNACRAIFKENWR